MILFDKHLLNKDALIKDALVRLNQLGIDAILFVVDEENRLIGSLTDGDVRRGFLKGLTFESQVTQFVQKDPKSIRKDEYNLESIIKYREANYKIIPVLDSNGRIVSVINFRILKSYLPVDAVVMAGGRGERLRPLTDHLPKPLLKVGDKTILEHNLDRIVAYGVEHLWVSVRYLGEKIQSHLESRVANNYSQKFVWENEPLGTIGSLKLVNDFYHDTILLINSDILTNLNFEDFFLSFLQSGADLSVVTIPYQVKIPYAVLETLHDQVISFNEKPTYTYYSNGGIYLLKRKLIDLIPINSPYNVTDLMEEMIKMGMKVHSYPMHGYWLDIGRMDDYKKAQEDIKYINL